jgi:subtilisin
MAGILVADGGPNGSGIYGFAPKASISVYRVCDGTGLCLSDDIAVAIRAATDAGAKIILLGMGGESPSSFVNDAIAYAADHDVLIVAAAGNDGPYEDSMDWPARNPAVVSVGAVDTTLTPADFSSRGTNLKTAAFRSDEGDIEFAAPGVNIESTFKDDGYAILSGTSMAAPHIAGLAALVWQSEAEHPAQATRSVLHELAKDLAPTGDDAATGWGIPLYVKKHE